MDNFFRVLRYTWPYRVRFVLSLLCALIVAVLWGANLSSAYPILTVLLENKSLRDWSAQRLRDTRNEVATHRKKLDQIDRQRAALARSSQAPAALRRKHRAERSKIRSAERTLAWETQLGKLINRYSPRDPFRALCLILALVMAANGLKNVFEFFQEYLVGSVMGLAQFDLRNRFYRKTLQLDLQAFADQGSSELMARFTNDMESISAGMRTLLGKVVLEPLKALSCLVFACLLSWQLTLIALFLVPLAALFMATVGRRMKRATKRTLEGMSSIYKILQESFQGIKIVKAFTNERYERQRLFRASKAYFKQSMRVVKLDAAADPLMEWMAIAVMVCAVLAGAHLVLAQNRTLFGVRLLNEPMEPSGLFTLCAVLAGISDPVRKLSNVYSRIQRAAAAADRVCAFMDRPRTVGDRPGSLHLERHHHSIEFDHLSFSYDGATPVLRDLNLRVAAGETIAIVGPNGSGKTTIMNLLLRFYDPTSGAIRVDGRDLRAVQLRSLRQQIGIVTQETLLFDDTVANNIAYGCRRASTPEIRRAAQRAYADGFIAELPDSYDTPIGEKGQRLSGGQKQRIALARAILRDPAILILDEATSALDARSEALLQKALEEFTQGRTTFMITHRLGTLQIADRILVLNQGRVEAIGGHAELIRSCSLYRRLHELHFQHSA